MNVKQENQKENLSIGGDNIKTTVKPVADNDKEARTLANVFVVIGLILMFVGSVIMFERCFISDFQKISSGYFEPEVEVFKSTSFGLFGLGIVSYLIGKNAKD